MSLFLCVKELRQDRDLGHGRSGILRTAVKTEKMNSAGARGKDCP